MNNKSGKKRKKGSQCQEEYGSKQLAELGIFEDEIDETNDEDDYEFCKDYI